jgi:hypothetical protein
MFYATEKSVLFLFLKRWALYLSNKTETLMKECRDNNLKCKVVDRLRTDEHV